MKIKNCLISFSLLIVHFYAHGFSYNNYNLSTHLTHSVSSFRGFFQQDIHHSASLKVTSKKEERNNFSVLFGYSHPWSFESRTRTLVPENYGWQDALLGLSGSFLEGFFLMNVVVPFSQMSRTQSLRTALALGVSYPLSFYNLKFDFSGYVRGFLHQYMVVGTSANPILSSNQALIVSYPLSFLRPFFVLSSSVNLLSFYDHHYDFYLYPQFEIQLSGSLKKAQVFISYFWNQDSRNNYLNLTQFFVPTNGFRFGLLWGIS